MDYIKYFDKKVKEGLDKNKNYQDAKNTIKQINDEIADIREKYPRLLEKDEAFDKLVKVSLYLPQSYAEREDEYDEYDYDIRKNFFDKQAVEEYKQAKAKLMQYYDQAGEFLKHYSHTKLTQMQEDLAHSKENMEVEENKTIKKVIVEQISSKELTDFINDFIKGTLPEKLGQYGNKVKDVISEEYKTMKEEDFKLRRQIQNEIQRVDNENEIF